jgi:hypothetical protein
METRQKQSADVVDFDVKFERWLPEGDTITTATAVVTAIDADTDLVVESYSVVDDGLTVKVWTSGGENGATYTITVTVATDGGRVKETEFKVRVKDV